MPTTTTDIVSVPKLQIHVLESTEQFQNLSDIDENALYFTPFDMVSYASDDDVVHLDDEEEIVGVKTFGTGIIVPEQEDLEDPELCNVATIQYVDDHGGQVDGVDLTINDDLITTATISADNNGRRIAHLDFDLDYVEHEEPVFTGANPPSFQAEDNDGPPVYLATLDDIVITDLTINNDPAGPVSIDEDGLANIDLTSYAEIMPEQSPQSVTQGASTINATLFNGQEASYYATKNDLQRYVALTDYNRDLQSKRDPIDHNHSLSELYINKNDASPQLLSNYLNSTFATQSHTHSTIISGGLTAGLPSGITGNQTLVLQSQLNAKFTYGTSGMTAGTTNLASGCFYFQYEE